jgi:hypothetical protein
VIGERGVFLRSRASGRNFANFGLATALNGTQVAPIRNHQSPLTNHPHPSWLLAIDMIGTFSASFLLQPVPVAGIMEARCRIV